MTLSDLASGSAAVVDSLHLESDDVGLAQRLHALGIVPEKPIQVLRKAGFGGPLHVRVGVTTEVAIRRREAARVKVRLA
jgi:ferrous iron transport protein A